MIIKRKKLTQQKPENSASPQKKPEVQFVEQAKVKPEIKPELTPPVPPPLPLPKEPTPEEELATIDISTIEFQERLERRRGDRRRGFRRIDERTLVSRAQEEAQSIRTLAAEEGYKKGLEDATEEVTRLKASLEEFLGMRAQVYEELSGDILEIALEVAKKIIKQEVDMNPRVLKNILKSVFEEINPSEQRVTVKVSKEEVDFARASLPEVLANSQIDAKILIIGDEAIEKGSCTVIGANGVIDANFSTQLAVVQNAFGIYKGGQ